MRRITLRVLLAVLVLSLAFGAWLAGTEPGARVAVAYVSGIVPNFKARHESGTLFGPLHLRTVVIKTRKLRIEADDLLLDWSPPCLLIGQFCVREARIATLTMTFAPPSAPLPPAMQKRTLPHINMPLTLDVAQLDIGTLDIQRNDKTTRYTRLGTAFTWDGEDLRVDRLVAGMPSWQATASGSLTTRDDWPLAAQLQFVTPREGTPTLAIKGSASGTFLDTRLVLQSRGVLDGALDGSLRVMQPGMPFTATLAAANVNIPPHGVPEKSAQARNLRLRGHGELLGQLYIDGDASIHTPWTPPLPARMQSRGTWRGLDSVALDIDEPHLRAHLVSDYRWLGGQHFLATADISHLDLSLVNKASPSRLQGRLLIDGSIDKQGTRVHIEIAPLTGSFRQWPLDVRGDLRWQDARWNFDALALHVGDNLILVDGTLAETWNADAALTFNDLHALLPAFAGTATGSARISGAPTDPSFRFVLDARDALMPAVTIASPPRTVRLPAADWRIEGTTSLRAATIADAHTVDAPFGVYAEGDISWQDALRWDIRSELDALPLHSLLPELQGTAGGSLASQGVLGATLEAVSVDTRLDGRLDDLPLHVEARAAYTPARTRIDNLVLTHATNRLQLSGELSTTAVQLAAQVDAPSLATSFRDYGGSLRASAQVGGPRLRPDVRMDIDASNLAWEDLVVGNLFAAINVADGAFAPSSATMNVSGLGAGGKGIDTATFSASGTRAVHELAVSASAGRLAGSIAVRGALSGDSRASLRWQGLLRDGAVSIDNWRWQTAGDAALAFHDDGFDIAPHCWSDGAARACITAPARLGRSGNLSAEVFHLPVESLLTGLLPVDTLLEGHIGGIFSADWTADGINHLDADIRNADDITASLAGDNEQRIIGQLSETSASAHIDAEGARVTARLHGAQTGTVEASASVAAGSDGNPLGGPLSGTVRVSDVRLDMAEAFTYQMRDIGGSLQGAIALDGTLVRPLVAGEIGLVNGRIGFTRVPLSLVDLNISSRFNGEHIGFSGGFRTPESTGSVRVDAEIILDGGNWHGDGTLAGEGMVIAALPEYQFTTAPDLKLALAPNRLGITGVVRVPAGKLELKSLPAQSIRRSRDVIVVREEQVIDEGGLGFNQFIDVDFALGDDVRFRAFGGEGRLAGGLRVRSRPELPLLVNGELHVHDGKYSAFGQALTLKNADVIFNGPADQPLIDALAVRTIDDAAVREVGLRLSGSLTAPQTMLWSQPAMADEEALSWLTTGRPLSDGPINLRGEAAQAALSLGVAQGSALLTAAGQEIGLQDVQLATLGEGEKAEVQVGTNLNERVFVGYNRRVFTGDESVLLRLQLTRRLMLEALSGLDSALDVFYTFEF